MLASGLSAGTAAAEVQLVRHVVHGPPRSRDSSIEQLFTPPSRASSRHGERSTPPARRLPKIDLLRAFRPEPRLRAGEAPYRAARVSPITSERGGMTSHYDHERARTAATHSAVVRRSRRSALRAAAGERRAAALPATSTFPPSFACVQRPSASGAPQPRANDSSHRRW